MNLRHRVHWQSENSAAGADDRSFADYSRNWPCLITPVGGSESYRGKQIEAIVTHVAEGRRITGVTPEMRLYDETNSRYLNIVRIVDTKDRKNNIEVHAVEVAA